jgi:predicted PurR-regulated permease PerM
MAKKKSFLNRYVVFLLTIILTLYAIIEARNFLYPVTFGILLAYLLYPLVVFLERHSVPRIIANLIAILFAIVVLGGTFFFFYKQVTSLAADFSSLKSKALVNVESLQHNLESYLGFKDNKLEVFLKEQVSNFFSKQSGVLGSVFSATTNTLFRILILPVYIFLFLYYRTKFAYFILKMVDRKNKQTAINILRDISTIAAKYMGGVAIVVFILCILNSAGLMIIGVEYAILFGILSAFFNFIPYFGTFMGGAFPLLFVLLTSDDPANMGLKVAVLYLIIQFTENNILTPNIVGGNVKLNPFFIIIGLVVGAMVWGIPGMLVIVPFLAIMRIIFKNIPKMEAYSFLLGPKGTQKHSITVKNIKKIFTFRKKRKELE